MQCYSLFTQSLTSGSSLITCAQLNLAMTVEPPNGCSTCWSFFPSRTDELEAVNKLTSEIVLGGTILSVKQLLKKKGGKTFAWADDRFTNGIREDVEIFESAKKHLRIQKFPDACGRGVRRLTFVSSPFQVLSLYKGTPFFYADIVGEVFHSNVT